MNTTILFFGRSTLFAVVIAVGGFASVVAQGLPDAAALPEEKGAWVIDQFYHSNIINGSASAIPNNTRILVQSDGMVFRLKIIEYGEFTNETGWCQDRFTNEEMRDVRSALGKFKPGVWKDNYGPLPNSLSPFGNVDITFRAADGKAVNHLIKLFQFNDLPADLVTLLNKVGEAGDLAFSNCQKSKPVK